MRLLRQGAYMNNVRRIADNIGISVASLLATHFEGSATVTFKLDTCEIIDARWAIHRAADRERRGQGRVDMLIGESADIDDKNPIRILPDYSTWTDYDIPPGGWEGGVTNKSVLARPVTDKAEAAAKKDEVSPEWKIIRELFMENVRGIYQADLYMLEEGGYESFLEYEKEWFDTKNGYCRPYNIVKPGLDEWPAYAGTPEHYKLEDLYNKYKQFTVVDLEDGNGMIRGEGAYNDSFHEFFVSLEYGKQDGIIAKFEQNVVRAPFAMCRELDHLHDKFYLGLDIRKIAKRDIGKISGGPEGCFHLVDIIADIAEMARGL